MDNLPRIHPGIKPGCLDRRPSASKRAADPHRLDGRDRRAWEAALLSTPGLKGSRLHLVRVLLDEFCWGKCWCFPGDELLARKCGLGIATIGRCLRDLARLGIIRILKVRGRRRIVFPSHPHAAAYLAGLGIPAEPAEAAAQVVTEVPGPTRSAPNPAADQNDRPDPAGSVAPAADQPDRPVDPSVPAADRSVPPVDQFDRRNVLVKPGIEARSEAAPARAGSPDLSPSGSNDLTREGEPPALVDWRKLVAEQGGHTPPRAVEAPARRRTNERPAPAPALDPAERTAIIAAALGDAVPAPDPGIRPERSAVAPRAATGEASAGAEAAAINALAKLGPGASQCEVLAATIRLTALLQDPGSRAFYRSVCNEVARGRLPARVPIAAVGSARGPGVRNPGAAFTAHMKRARAATEARSVRSPGP